MDNNSVVPIDSNIGDIKTNPKLSTDTAAKTAAIANNLGINLDPVGNFKPSEKLNTDLAPDASQVRSIANVGDVQASLVQKSAKELSTVEKYLNNIKLQRELSDNENKFTDIMWSRMWARNNNKDISPEQVEEADILNTLTNDIAAEREAMGLNIVESALTGGVVSVFNDTYEAAKDNPVNAVVASSGLLGFLAGPVAGLKGLQMSTSAATAAYNWKRIAAKEYYKLDENLDANGNQIPHGEKMGIAMASSTVQTMFEFAADMLLLKTTKLFKLDGIGDTIARKAMDNPTFRNKLTDFGKRAATQGFGESIAEMSQELMGDMVSALGETWTSEEGYEAVKTITKFWETFDVSKLARVGGEAAITGGALVGIGDTTRATFDGGKKLYNKFTGKNIDIDSDNTLKESDPVWAKSEQQTGEAPITPPVKFELPERKNKAKIVVQDGVPKYLDEQEAILVSEIIPNINSVHETEIAKDTINREKLQVQLAEKMGSKIVFVSKEKAQEWAKGNKGRETFLDTLLDDSKGAILDAQDIPMTWEEYTQMQTLGDVDFINDNTAVTSGGVTVGEIKTKLREMGNKDIPDAQNIPTSDEVNVAGEVDLTPDGEITQAVDTTNLGVDSTDVEIVDTLKTKDQADAYLQRLVDEEANLSNEAFEKAEIPLEDQGIIKEGTDFSGEIITTHTSKNENLTFMESTPVDQQNDVVFGNNVSYFDESGLWSSKNKVAPSMRWGPHDNTYKAKLRFEKAFVLTPDTLNNFISIVGKFKEIIPFSKEGAEYLKNIRNKLEAVGYDGLIIRGMDKLHSEQYKNLQKKYPLMALDWNDPNRQGEAYKQQFDDFFEELYGNRELGALQDSLQDQVLSFNPQKQVVSLDKLQSNDLETVRSALRPEGTTKRIEQLQQMRTRVESLKDQLADEAPPAPPVDEAIQGFENFGDITENVLDQMSDTAKAEFVEQVTKAKGDMKLYFRDEVINEYEQTASIQEREANLIAEDEIINNITSDENILIVDTFLADESLRIDPTTLDSNQTDQFVNNPDPANKLKSRRVFKKGGMHIEEVAAQIGTTPDQLLEVLAYVPTSKQAFDMQAKLEMAKNKYRAKAETTLNEEAITKTIDDKISLKRKLLNAILSKSPNAGLNLIHSIFKIGKQTSVDNIKIDAQRITDNTAIKNLSPKAYLNAARRHFNRAHTALFKNKDMGKAAAEIEKSMVADELHKASTKSKAKVDRLLDKVTKRIRDTNLHEKLKSTGHYKAFEALTALLGHRKMTDKDTKAISQLLITWVDKGLEPDNSIPENLLPALTPDLMDTPQDVNNLSASQIETITSYIDQLIADSDNMIKERRESKQVFGKLVEEVVVDEVKNNIHNNGTMAGTYEPGGRSWLKQGISYFTRGIRAAESIIQNLQEQVDRFKFGDKSILNSWVRELKGIGNYDNGMGTKGHRDLSNKIKDMILNIAGKNTMTRIIGYAGKTVMIPEWANALGDLSDGKGNVKLTDVLGMLLVYGSKDGKQRLAKYGIDVNQIIPIAERVLHEDDIKYVEAVYKAHVYLQKGITYVEQTLRGYNDVEFVKGDNFTWHGREIEGGYVHFSYKINNNLEAQARWDKDSLDEVFGKKFSPNNNVAAHSFTKEGFKKARAANVDAFVNLDLNTLIDNSLGAIVANNTMLVPIYHVMSHLTNPKIKSELTKVFGQTGMQVFENNVIALGKNTSIELHKMADALDRLILRPAQKLAENFMSSKLLGNLGSLFNTAIGVNNAVFHNLESGRVHLIPKMVWTMLKMMINPKRTFDTINQMAKYIPSIKTDLSAYMVKNVNTLKVFEGSESKSKTRRLIVNGTNMMNDIWFSYTVGSFDTFFKTAYALALADSYLNGDLSKSKKDLDTMTDNDVIRDMNATINTEIGRVFVDKDPANVSYLQRHPVGKLFSVFFNDARIALNYVVGKRLYNAWDSLTQFPEDAAKKGLPKAIANSSKDVVGNLLVLHIQLAVIDGLLRSFRGEDENEDKNTRKNWFERFGRILVKNLTDIFAAPKIAAEMLPGGSNISYFFKEERNREGTLKIPVGQFADTVGRTIKHIDKVGFRFDLWTDAQKRDAMNAISGFQPIPVSIINNYVFGDSTAFQTGLEAAVIAPYAAIEVAKDAVALLKDSTDGLAKAKTPEEEQFYDSQVNAQEAYLLETSTGRETLKNEIVSGKFEYYSEDERNDIIFLESNGDPYARPIDKKTGELRSSALGITQATVGTWNDYNERLGLDKAYGGKKINEKDGRLDAYQSMVFLKALHNDIAFRLIDEGVMPDVGGIYIGHHFGKAVAPSIIKAESSESLKDVYVSALTEELIPEYKRKGSVNPNAAAARAANTEFDKAVKGNPWLKEDATIGDFKNKIIDLLDDGFIKRMEWEEINGPFDPVKI